MRVVAAALMFLPFYSLAQAPQSPPSWPSQQSPFPQGPSGPDMRNPEVRHAIEKQQATYLAYQKCIGDHQKEFELYTAASQLIQVRNNRAGIETGLASSPAMRARWPGGYEQIVGATFETYRKAGGTAANADAVVAGVDPCSLTTAAKPGTKP